MSTQHGVAQNTSIGGNDHEVMIAGRDIIVQRPAHDPATAPAREGKPRPMSRWLGILMIGGLALGSTAPLLLPALRPRPAAVRATSPAGSPIPVASTGGTSRVPGASNHIAAAPRPAERTPAQTPRSEPVTRVPSHPSSIVRAIVKEPGQWPDGKSALCRDGSFSASQHRGGTCSRHQGVAFWRYDADHPYWQSGRAA